MRNNPFQFSFSLPLPLVTKAMFYDFHRSLQRPLLLIIANSSSSLPDLFTFKPTLLLWVLFSFLQLPAIPQLRVGVQEHRYQILFGSNSSWSTRVGNLPMFYVAAVPKNTFKFLCVWLWGWVGWKQHNQGALLEIKTEAPTLKCRTAHLGSSHHQYVATKTCRWAVCWNFEDCGKFSQKIHRHKFWTKTVYFSSICIYFQKHRYQLNHYIFFFSK